MELSVNAAIFIHLVTRQIDALETRCKISIASDPPSTGKTGSRAEFHDDNDDVSLNYLAANWKTQSPLYVPTRATFYSPWFLLKSRASVCIEGDQRQQKERCHLPSGGWKGARKDPVRERCERRSSLGRDWLCPSRPSFCLMLHSSRSLDGGTSRRLHCTDIAKNVERQGRGGGRIDSYPPR